MAVETSPRPAFTTNPWWVTALLWLVLAAAAAAALWHLRRDLIDGQARELGLLSLALTDEIDRGLRGAEEGLRALREEMAQDHLPPAPRDATRALRTRADLMPLVSTLWLVDGEGRVIAGSDATPPPALADFAPALPQLGDDAVAVSRPFSRAVAGVGAIGPQRMVGLAMRLRPAPRTAGAEGGAAGWILAAMPAGVLLGAFTAALPAADARMAVFRSDGVRLAGANVPAPLGDEAAIAERLAGRPSMEVRSFQDGSDNLVGLHGVPRYALKVVVSRQLSAVLEPWRQALQVTAAALALLLFIVAAAVHLVQRANRRRREAQQALQAQLAQRARAGKLESLGTLAGGVAHDFNNVLAGIVGWGEMAQDAAVPGSDQARHLDKMLQAALRGKALVERILAFSRGGARTSAVFELEPVVEEVLDLLSGSLRPGLVLERALDAPGGRLRGDATQAFEAVMNLCTNALQSMPQGGLLSVQLRREHTLAARVLSHSALAAGDWLALSVSDQGGGITPAVMEHLFEPFFTTRGANSGTGLGLAVVHGVVAEMGGAIDVQSRPGAGARFTLYFPECTLAPGPAGASTPAPQAGAAQRLLVVDDEPGLVALALEMLQGLGYAPEGCTDAAAALQRLREQPQYFAAVLIDEVMPGLTGTGLTAAVRAFAPALPVLLVSGWGGALLARRAAEAGVSRVLAKPLQRADLARALGELLH
jgi:signal transduction histidine kinase